MPFNSPHVNLTRRLAAESSMSLRKTSCAACVSAKRRCDRGLPLCRRCTQKSLPCEYPYPPTGQSDSTNQEEPIPSDTAFSGLGNIDSLDVTEFLDFSLTEIDGPSVVDAWESVSSQIAANLEHLPVPEPDEALHSLLGPCSSENASNLDAQRATDHSRRHRKQRRRASQQARQTSIAPPLQGIWPRGCEVETWSFCAKELLSFVTLFATTATSPFILQPTDNGLHASLQRALGVCAASCTLSEPPFDQLLEAEMQHLINASVVGDMSVVPEDAYSQALFAFRQNLARLQAMVLYQIIGLFSTNLVRQHRAKQNEALMASWTRELLLCIQLLELKSKVKMWMFPYSNLNNYQSVREEPPVLSSTHDMPLQKEEIESAYRTILVSYLARCVHSILRDQKGNLIPELGLMPVLVPSQQGTIVSLTL